MNQQGLGENRWLSFHVYYYDPRDVVVDLGLRPLAAELLTNNAIENFFFIRYSLGGPHIRARFLPRRGATKLATSKIRQGLESFLRAHPSTTEIDADVIDSTDAGLLANDQHETPNDSIRPFNNSVVDEVFRPETSRYGGMALLPGSLDMFAISSVVALDWLADARHLTPGRRLNRALRLLLFQALGTARSTDALVDLVGYSIRWWDRLQPIADKADQVFEKSSVAMAAVVKSVASVTEASGRQTSQLLEGPGGLLFEGAMSLRDHVEQAPLKTVERIAESHLHMTANRIGLLNTDEAYLGQLLKRSLEAWRQDDPVGWRSLDEQLQAQSPAAGTAIADIRRRALASFAAGSDAT